MKVTDFSTIQQEIVKQLYESDLLILDILDENLAVLAIMNVYLSNDSVKAMGQDYHNKCSIISSRDRISVIMDGAASFYKAYTPICMYEELEDDITQIIMMIETVFERIMWNQG